MDRERLRYLAGLRSEKRLIVSLYLPLEKGEPGEAKLPIRLKNLINEALEAKESWTPEQIRSVEEDLARIERLVAEERVLGSKSVIAFASSPLGLWEVFRPPVGVGKGLAIDHVPRVAPLIAFAGQLERYCTVLIDKSRSRIFFLDLGSVEERYDIYGVVPGRHDQGGWAQARYQRHHDDHVMHHLKDTAYELFRLHHEEGFHSLLVAGTEEVVTQFADYLHPYLKESLVATLTLEMTASPKEVQEQSLAIVEDLKKREEANLIEKLKGEALSGRLGVIGLEDTLHAWQAGQAFTLLINEGFHAPGRRCPQCGSLTVREGSCPYCNQTLEPLRDVVEELIKRAFLGNTEIKSIAGENKEALAEMGKIGALLRFTT